MKFGEINEILGKGRLPEIIAKTDKDRKVASFTFKTLQDIHHDDHPDVKDAKHVYDITHDRHERARALSARAKMPDDEYVKLWADRARNRLRDRARNSN